MTHRILLATVGMTPQVVTETLYLLARAPEPWTPDRVEIVTTGRGVEVMRNAWPQMRRALDALFAAGAPPLALYALRGDKGGVATLEWPGGAEHDPAWPDAKAELRTDIVSIDDVEGVGDLIKDRVWEHVRRQDSELHLSIAGGRKTMSAHALLSLALLGRPQDDASHVLAAPPFEENEAFWHPGQGGLVNTTAELRAARASGIPLPPPTLDPSKAELRLIRTPAPLVAEMPANRDALGRLRFSEILQQIDLVRRFRLRPSVVFDDRGRTVTICGLSRQLVGKSYVQLRLVARAMREQWPGVGGDGRGGAGWLSIESMIGQRGPKPGPFELALNDIDKEPGLLKRIEPPRKDDVTETLEALWEYRSGRGKARDVRVPLARWLKSIQMTEMSDAVEIAFGPLLAGALLLRVGKGPIRDRRIGLGCGPEAISGTV
jgi:CRISPR-associated protein (TIGR02584 family)